MLKEAGFNKVSGVFITRKLSTFLYTKRSSGDAEEQSVLGVELARSEISLESMVN